MLNPLDYEYTVCRKCGETFLGYWLSDGLCMKCYFREKFKISEVLWNCVLNKEEFQQLPLREKISRLSDWEEEHPEDREGVEKIKEGLIGYLKKVIEHERKIAELEMNANIMLRTASW